MVYVAYPLAVLLGGLGLVFIIGAQGQVARFIIGGVLLVSAAALIALTRLRPSRTEITQKIDLSGDVSLEQMECRDCGADLPRESISLEAGAIFVECDHCGSSYQIEEKPKW